MGKKVIINESAFKEVVVRQFLAEADMSKDDIVNAVKNAIKNDPSVKKDMEKKVKEIVAATVNTLFKTLWQRRNFYEDEIKR